VRHLPRFLAGRMAIALLQALLITTAVFFLLRVLPGDPAYALAGPSPTPERIEGIRHSLRLDQPLWNQYTAYVSNLVRGDWGRSITSGQNVLDDILRRFPATIELITSALILSIILTIPWAGWSAMRSRGLLARIGMVYGRLAGSLPDFWFAILLVLVFFSWLQVAPPPIGRLDLLQSPPPRVTGMHTIDSLLAGDLALFGHVVAHMILPVTALVGVVGSVFYRQTRRAMEHELTTTRTLFARAGGLSERQIAMKSLRNALPPVVALVGNTYAYLMGGAVLVESVFSWGGLGQYAVQAVQASDYFAISGVVLVSSLFTLMIYLLVDLVNAWLDPRVRAGVRGG
jgi:ABC-type dipeptide/oligopeptide/nickel transport system permease component